MTNLTTEQNAAIASFLSTPRDITAAGYTAKGANLTELHPDALAAIFAYGLRKINDTLNSQAKAKRDEGKEFDAAKAFVALWTDYKAGIVSQRAPSTPSDPMEAFRKAVGMEYIRGTTSNQKLAAKGYKAIDAKDQKARTAFLVAMVEGTPALEDLAQRRKADTDAMAAFDVEVKAEPDAETDTETDTDTSSAA